MNRFISDKEVYEKQQKNYNIISVQPREYPDTIKVFPKYRLENEDQNYFKKLQLEKEFANKLQVNKELFKRQSSLNPEVIKKPMRGKYLNNVDEVADIIWFDLSLFSIILILLCWARRWKNEYFDNSLLPILTI